MDDNILGYFSAYDYVVPARGKILAKTDIQIAVPEGCYGRVGRYSNFLHLVSKLFLCLVHTGIRDAGFILINK